MQLKFKCSSFQKLIDFKSKMNKNLAFQKK